MSNAATLTEEQYVLIREFTGHPPKRKDGNRIVMGILYTQDGELEYALNQLTPVENGRVAKHLADLTAIEDALTAAVGDVDTAQAAVWTRNAKTFEELEAALLRGRLRLCALIGVLPGPNLSTGASHWVM